MSRTLFWYVFKDLLRVFLLTCLALAGIMSFGGLLQPLTKQGLEASQIGHILTYLVPAMTTFALPIAALFATTMVYGRLSADNELTACRASGISHLSVATPALLLGLFVSILSLLLLCFIVPRLTLQVERIIKSNIARVVANEIDRGHQIQIGDYTVFAQSAHLYPPDPKNPRQQVVSLEGPMFVNYEPVAKDLKSLQEVAARDPAGKVAHELATRTEAEQKLQSLIKMGVPDTQTEVAALKAEMTDALKRARQAASLRIPREFWMARQATVYIKGSDQDQGFTLSARLDDGYKFPRTIGGNGASESGGIGVLNYGPVELPPLIVEKPKFKDIRELKILLADPGQSSTIRGVVAGFIRAEQQSIAAKRLTQSLNSAGLCIFDTGSETYSLTRADALATAQGADVVVPSSGPAGPPGSRGVHLESIRDKGLRFAADANQIRLHITADNDEHRLVVEADLIDAMIINPEGKSPQSTAKRRFSVPMPADIAAMQQRSPESYIGSKLTSADDQQKLRRELLKLSNYIQSEMHARSSFAISCLILVMIGAALGMMFKSGNFLSAFAVSAIPALLCIALIVTGQHTVENIPTIVTASNNPLRLGLAIIWSGNLAVLAIGVVLLTRLQRQ